MVKTKKVEQIIKSKGSKILNSLQWILYSCFVFLWFKNNIYSLRKVKVSFFIPLVALSGVLFVQLFLRMKSGKIKIRAKFTKTSLVLILVLFVALLFRIPYLIYNSGMVTSDDAIPALMAKHISEGKVPPICFYGQVYMGSLSSHFLALIYKVFGYSVFALKFSSLLFFLAFVALHFLFLKELFSLNFSLLVSLFYCLPIGHLLTVSFDNSISCSLVLFLGISLIYISYLISYKKREKWIPFLGFLLGLSFWTHQLTACFILTSLIIVGFKAKPSFKKYAALLVFSLIGVLPQLMLEISEKFKLVRFLFPGAGGNLNLEKIKRTANQILSLLSIEIHPLGYTFLLFLFLGFASASVLAIKKKRFLPQISYSLFFVIFILIYLFSDFSNTPVWRYLVPLYFCLPVFLVSSFSFLRSRIKYFLSLALVLLLFFSGNLKGSYSYFISIKDLHLYLDRVVKEIEQTGKQYWFGDYWTAYLLTALAKEKIIVSSYTVNRYYPYSLLYYNQGQNNNFIFLRGESNRERKLANNLIYLLDIFDIGFKKKTIGDCWLIYDVESQILPNAFIEGDLPSQFPHLELNKIQASGGYLHLIFKNMPILEGFKFRVNVEIPDFSRIIKEFSAVDKIIKARIPFPEKKSFNIKYYLDYKGLRIGPSSQALSYSPERVEAGKERIIYLSGFGPLTKIARKKMIICEKEVKLKINKAMGKEMKIRLHLYSPFEFSKFYWYGEYSQQLRIDINQHPLLEKALQDGENVVEFEIKGSENREEKNILTLRFEYHLPFAFAYRWRTAALLEKIELE